MKKQTNIGSIRNKRTVTSKAHAKLLEKLYEENSIGVAESKECLYGFIVIKKNMSKAICSFCNAELIVIDDTPKKDKKHFCNSSCHSKWRLSYDEKYLFATAKKNLNIKGELTKKEAYLITLKLNTTKFKREVKNAER